MSERCELRLVLDVFSLRKLKPSVGKDVMKLGLTCGTTISSQGEKGRNESD